MEEPDVPEGSGELDPEGQMPGQLPAAATHVEEVEQRNTFIVS